jgi:hypothetical protein
MRAKFYIYISYGIPCKYLKYFKCTREGTGTSTGTNTFYEYSTNTPVQVPVLPFCVESILDTGAIQFIPVVVPARRGQL